MTFAWMDANQAHFPVAVMAQVFGVSRSGFYYWKNSSPTARQLENEELLTKVQASHERSKQTYGAVRIHHDLSHQGHTVSLGRVERLMKKAGLKGVCKRRGYRSESSKPPRPQGVQDLVKRDFSAQGPNQLWVCDITEFWTKEGRVYLAVVLDVFSRKIVGWSMESHKGTSLIVQALKAAIQRRQASEVIHHSDQGSQYTSKQFSKACKDAGVVMSMSRVGSCYDNAMCESWFATLKCELVHRTRFETREESRMAVFEYIEGWYNPHRLHSALGYLSPENFERLHA